MTGPANTGTPANGASKFWDAVAYLVRAITDCAIFICVSVMD